jgi:hypothetical protein
MNGWSSTTISTVWFNSVEGENYFSVQSVLPQPGKFMACIQKKIQVSHLRNDTILIEVLFPAFPQPQRSNAFAVYQIQLSLQFIIH